ncbi:MAG: hypothetical protein JWP74_2333 [Marmoricola sp.]|nr:hypothetical protein [Marmoricola sp.]
MSDAGRATGTGFGRVLVFVYGIFAFSASGRSSYQLIAHASEAPLAYSLSAFAAIVYIVATWALGTSRHSVATCAVVVEMLGVIIVGATIHTSDPHKATVWSGFGSGYGYVPLVLPFVGLWWLYRTRPE